MSFLDPKLQINADGKYDFTLKNGSLELTDDQMGPILRLLRQGKWIADQGERDGESLDDVRFDAQTTESRIRAILQVRLRILVLLNRLESVSVLQVIRTHPGIWWFSVQVKRVGKSPQTIQLPVTV